MSAEPHASTSVNEIDLRQLISQVQKGLPQIFGLSLLGAAVAACLTWIAISANPIETTMRIAFSFPGFERGLYPDDSKFQADDLRAPELTNQALENLRIDNGREIHGVLRSSISVIGIIPPNISKERDRLRAAGQNPPPFIPDEYQVSLDLPRGFPVSYKERQLFLNELVTLYQKRFSRTFADLPIQYGTSFDLLRNSDYFEYDLILSQELQNLSEFLSKQAQKAKNFRSPTTGRSFADLVSQSQLFSQMRVNEVMGMIYSTGLTNNKAMALTKINYQLGLLDDEERRLVQQESVVRDLLAQAQSRSQSYVLTAKAQIDSSRPFVDQGLMDSLIANDAYNLLVRKALDAGYGVQDVRSRKERVVERRKRIEEFVPDAAVDKLDNRKLLVKAMADLETDYNRLISQVRLTQQDWAKQQFADAIRTTAEPKTIRSYTSAVIAGIAGLLIGLLIGTGLSLVGVYIHELKQSATS